MSSRSWKGLWFCDISVQRQPGDQVLLVFHSFFFFNILSIYLFEQERENTYREGHSPAEPRRCTSLARSLLLPAKILAGLVHRTLRL